MCLCVCVDHAGLVCVRLCVWIMVVWEWSVQWVWLCCELVFCTEELSWATHSKGLQSIVSKTRHSGHLMRREADIKEAGYYSDNTIEEHSNYTAGGRHRCPQCIGLFSWLLFPPPKAGLKWLWLTATHPPDPKWTLYMYTCTLRSFTPTHILKNTHARVHDMITS